jgi:DNA-binding response OmpR family regulator
MKNILIVEDESIVALEISVFVQELGYNLSGTATSANKALEIMASSEVDLVLMDVSIKGDVDGISCASEMKKLYDIPIIYISAFSDDETLHRAIETNPSAYLIKPFNQKELKVAMSLATNTLSASTKVGDIVLDNEFSFDTQNSELLMRGEIVHLTKKEKLFLSLLLESKSNIVTFYEMENYLWEDKKSNENTRRALVSRLRAKLNYKFLETIHSIGYRISI